MMTIATSKAVLRFPDIGSARGCEIKPVDRLPAVAVLLSTYNGARHLSEQLDSLREQRGVRVLVHARDDGSQDATPAILCSYQANLPDFALMSGGSNLGVAASFFELLRTAPEEADYFAFCDQDDVWLPDKLARATKALENCEGPALYCSAATLTADDLSPLGRSLVNAGWGFNHLLFENFAIGCTIVLNREARALIVERLPGRGVVVHDWWCALVVAAFGRIVFDSEPGLLYRQHGANVVGMRPGLFVQRVQHVRRLLRSPSTFYAVHGQATEFKRLFGSDLSQLDCERLDRLVSSRRSLARRLAYAASEPMHHSDWIGKVAVRGLIAAGWY